MGALRFDEIRLVSAATAIKKVEKDRKKFFTYTSITIIIGDVVK